MEGKGDGLAIRQAVQAVSRPKLVIFDFDGTLVDTAPDITDSANTALKRLGCQPRGIEEVKAVIGFGVKYLMRELLKLDLKEVPEDLIEKAAEFFREHYEAHSVEKTRAYPRVVEVLDGPLESLSKAIVTNKPHHLTHMILSALDLGRFFDPVIGTGWKYPAKPAVDAVQAVMAYHAKLPHETLMIGDSEVDYRTAQKAGVAFGWVRYGYDSWVPEDGMLTFSSPWDWRTIADGDV